MKLDWGLTDIELPVPGEKVTAEQLSAMREWVDAIAYRRLTTTTLGIDKQIEILSGALIINATIGYLCLVEKMNQR